MQGAWSEEELTTLREAFHPGDDWRESVREVSIYFPERGVRDITHQLRAMGLITANKKSTKISCSNMAWQDVLCVYYLSLSLFFSPSLLPSLSLSLSLSPSL